MVSGEKTIREYKKFYSSSRKSRRNGEPKFAHVYLAIGESAPEHADASERPLSSQSNAREYKKFYRWSRKSQQNGEKKMVCMFWPTGKVFRSMLMHLLKCPSDLAVMTTSPQRSGLLSSVSSTLQELSRAIHSTRGSWWLTTCYAKATLFHAMSGLKRGRTK